MSEPNRTPEPTEDVRWELVIRGGTVIDGTGGASCSSSATSKTAKPNSNCRKILRELRGVLFLYLSRKPTRVRTIGALSSIGSTRPMTPDFLSLRKWPAGRLVRGATLSPSG